MNSKAPRKRASMSAKARKKYRLVSFAIAAALIFTVFGINAVLKHSVSDDDYAVDHPPVVNTSFPGGAQLTDAATTFVYSPETPTPSPIPTETPVPTATPVPTPTPIPTPVPTPVDLEYPYLIELDKGKQVVTVYTIGEDGYYSLVVKQFICSSGHSDKVEDGMYKLGEKYRWKQMENQSFAQYACRISGPYLFHSCCYYSEKGNKLKAHYYDQLGDNVSSGCVRLLAGDAYWIYTNCPTGTPIHVMHSPARDVELLESLKPPERKGNWDPTDPDPKNPYYVSPPPDTTPDPTSALGVTPAPTALWTVHPKLKAWGKY